VRARLGWMLALVIVAGTAAGEERYPAQGLTPPEKVGGMVSIAGSPLPPVPRESVRTAIAVYEPILSGVRLLGSPDMVARGCGYLATLYAAVGDLRKAESLFDEAQKLLETNGGDARDLGWVYNNRGLVQFDEGQHADGLRAFRKAVAVLDPRREDLLEPRAIALQNMGSAYGVLGDAANSESAYLSALDILRMLRKEGTRPHQTTRGNLAIMYSAAGDYAEARKILEPLVRERGLTATLRFQILNNLGYTLTGMKAFPEAEARLKEALEVAGGDSRARAFALMNLGGVYVWSGDFERAEKTGSEALELVQSVYGERSRPAAAAMGNLGKAALSRGELLRAQSLFSRARDILVKQPGDEEALIFVLRGLGTVAQRRGQHERARALSREALDLSKAHLERMVAYGTETQRLAYHSFSEPWDQLANLGDADLLAEAALAMKGAVLESLLAERALARKSTAPADQEQIDRIHALKIEIMEKLGRGSPAAVERLQRELKREQAALMKRLAARPFSAPPRIDLKTLQAALADDQALIEILRFQRHADGGKVVPSYGAIVIARNGAPRWIPLGDADQVDNCIETLVGRFEPGNRGVATQNPNEGPVVALLRELNDDLWAPLAAALPEGTKRILLSPDAATSFVPWGSLLDEEQKFLAERWQLTQVGSGRDLMRAAEASRGDTLVAFGDGGEDLRYARQEVQNIARAAEQLGWRATVLIGEAAAETDLLRHPRPRILHLATHAGQLRGETPQTIDDRLSRNPMYRGYLLLGGGRRTLEAWKSGSSAPFASDGVLTAEEASSLDLSGTWLTVLSACDTGAGDVRAGEGVLGLRRGFALAGTRNLLFSLWSVRDDATAEFMTAFYERLFRDGDPARAFQETQVAELLRWKHDRDISSAVYRAGAFVLTQ
jgi:CHAT domain-containing protein/tetratricopeptide (TPR) repeat protein